MHAALEYSPLMNAPRHHDDVYAYVARQIEERFWTDIYVDRPEIREIIFTLETGQLVLVTGERGTGKSTAIRAVVRELTHGDGSAHPRADNLIPYVFDANEFAANLQDAASIAETIQGDMYEFLRKRIDDRAAWLGYLYECDDAFEEFRLTVESLEPKTPEDWHYLGTQPDYGDPIKAGNAAFAARPVSERLRRLLTFIGERTVYEPLLILDNVDQLTNEVVTGCGLALSAIVQSSSYRIRGAIAVRPENADAIQHVLDTAIQPSRISLMQRPLAPNELEKPPIHITLSFIEKRFAVLKEPETIEKMRSAINPEKAAVLAAGFDEENFTAFLDSVLELLDIMIYDIFRTDEENEKLKRENWEFAGAVHSWHNGSLRECGLSLTMFASDILQDKTHMYQLRDLLQSVIRSREQNTIGRRRKLRRVTRSLLYRHLLFWAVRESETATRPLKNVMVFDGNEETTNPPIHFLRLRILQYLAKRQRGRATVANIRDEMGRLKVESGRVDEALCELAIKRTQDDAGLVRIDGFPEPDGGEPLPTNATVQLLGAGRFLVETLYVTTEYLFWSALNTDAATGPAAPPREVTSEQIQSDAFRTYVATRYLERYLVEKFRDEHPYLRGFSDEWTPQVARRRLRLYEMLFGFSKENWFLDRAARSLTAFIPSRDPDPLFEEAKAAIERVRELSHALDLIMAASARS